MSAQTSSCLGLARNSYNNNVAQGQLSSKQKQKRLVNRISKKTIKSTMEEFEAQLARDADPSKREILGAIGLVVNGKGKPFKTKPAGWNLLID